METAMKGEQRPALGGKSFEDLKRTNEQGAEYWSARDIRSLRGYDQWRRFENAIQKAQTSCEQSGNDCDHQFAGAGKMIGIGKDGVRNVPDYHPSRFACYLIAQAQASACSR
jgi:DNA-damage-inducible protein D